MQINPYLYNPAPVGDSFSTLLAALDVGHVYRIVDAIVAFDLDGIVEEAAADAPPPWDRRLEEIESRFEAALAHAHASPELDLAIDGVATCDRIRRGWRATLLVDLLRDASGSESVLRAALAAARRVDARRVGGRDVEPCGSCGLAYVFNPDGESYDTGAPDFAPVCVPCATPAPASVEYPVGVTPCEWSLPDGCASPEGYCWCKASDSPEPGE